MSQRFVFFLILLISTPAFAANKELVITMGGDVNFNIPAAGVNPNGTQRFGGLQPWNYFTSGIAQLITGDLNFANIETVVTDRTLNSRQNKSFNFQSHTNALRHMISLGFNLFSMANNHAYDYGYDGLYMTASEMLKLKSETPRIAYHGVGTLNEVLHPTVFKVKGVTVAFASIGIMDGVHNATPDRPGMMNIMNANLRSQLLANMRAVHADYKILSIHYGTENVTSLDGGQRAMFNQFLDEGDLDMIIGHHPHVTRPVERVGNKVIFYSLGNYLMLGAKDMGSMHGLFARVQLKWDESLKRMKLTEVQAIPLLNMHIQPTPYQDVGTSAIHVNRLNTLSISQLGANGAMIFQAQPNGYGVYRAQ